MKTQKWLKWSFWITCLVCWLSPLSSVRAEEGEAVVTQVQEDWVLVLNVPDESVDCPQFHTIMSPYANTGSLYFQINWNYREQPETAGGGLEMLTWSGDSLLKSKTMRTEELSTTAETITWTQAMVTSGSLISFVIRNGHSQTWGSFSTFSIGITPGLNDLSTYSPDVSVANSWITYGSNRVEVLKIVQIRYYDNEGHLLKTDSSPRIVYQASSPVESDEDSALDSD